jgi:Flp pilus assembly protein TadB
VIAVLLLVWSLAGPVPVARRRLVARRAARRPGAAAAAGYFDSVASELRRGAVLRQALAIPVPGTRLARLALTGQPIELVAVEARQMFALDDDLATAGIRLAGRSGAPAGVLFARLAERLRAAEQSARDRRALTAQARLSAVVIGVLPVVPAVMMLASGQRSVLLEPGPGRSMVVAGLVLQALGLIVIGALLRADK